MVRFVARNLPEDPERAHAFARAALALKAVVLVACLGSGFFLAPIAAQAFFHDSAYTLPLRLALVMALGQGLWRYTLALLQAHQLFGRYLLTQIAGNVFKVALLVLLSLASLITLGRVLSVYIATLTLGALIGYLLRPLTPIRKETSVRSALGELFRFSRWLVLSCFMIMAYNRLGLILLGRFFPGTEVGQFSVSLTLINVIDFITLAILTVLLPQVSRLAGRKEYDRYVRKTVFYLVLIILAFLPLFFLARPLIGLVYGQDFSGAVGPFRLIFWGAAFNLISEPLVLIFYAQDRPQLLAFTDGVVLTFNLAVCLIFIPYLGAVGAALAALASRGLKAAMLAYFTRRYVYV